MTDIWNVWLVSFLGIKCQKSSLYSQPPFGIPMHIEAMLQINSYEIDRLVVTWKPLFGTRYYFRISLSTRPISPFRTGLRCSIRLQPNPGKPRPAQLIWNSQKAAESHTQPSCWWPHREYLPAVWRSEEGTRSKGPQRKSGLSSHDFLISARRKYFSAYCFVPAPTLFGGYCDELLPIFLSMIGPLGRRLMFLGMKWPVCNV